jgi:hypothetical protein
LIKIKRSSPGLKQTSLYDLKKISIKMIISNKMSEIRKN